MERLFGIPLGALAVVLLALLAGAFGILAVLAVRNRVFLRLGLRNVRRRKGRTALIVGGLMLATTIIASALGTGDTMSSTIRSSVLRNLGMTDETITVAGATVDPMFGTEAAARSSYFAAGSVATVQAAGRTQLIDGITPAVIEPIAVQDLSSRQSEPRVSLFGTDPASMNGFGRISAKGRAVSMADLGAGEVFLTAKAADKLHASPGDRVLLFAGPSPAPARVRDVVRFDGAGGDGTAVLTGLTTAQRLVGEPGRINQILVSNQGGATGGARHTDAVIRRLAPTLRPLGLEAQPVKRDGLDQADEQGNAFMSLFSLFGSFSIVAGVLLIFLIFVMLAAERRTEMGVSRAVGTQRGHLIQMFLFEGAAYDILAAAVGALAGLGVAYVMVEVVAGAFASEAIEIRHQIRFTSLATAYGLGVVLTLAVVAVSAWRVSVLDIVTAIRNLPAPLLRRSPRSRWRLGIAGVVLGTAMAASGAGAHQATPFQLGASLVIVSLVPIARALGLPTRVAYTIGGVALVVWWLLPWHLLEPLVGELKMDFSVWILAGIMLVLGATWTIMYNADVVLAAIDRLFGRVRGLAPVVRMAVAYPLRSRLRTAMTLAMFMLVVFTLVTGTTISNAFISANDDLKAFGGGFDVRAATAPVSPIPDPASAFPRAAGLPAGSVRSVGSQSLVPVEAKPVAGTKAPADYLVRGLDDGFLRHTTYALQTRARGYRSSAEVWKALRTRPDLAVVDQFVVPRRNNFGGNVPPDFQMVGFVVEDQSFTPAPVVIRDPATRTTMRVTVIGVLADTAPFEMAGITVSQRTLAPLGERARPTAYWLDLGPGVDAKAAAKSLESDFLDHGLEAQALRDRLDEEMGAARTFGLLIQGFIGLGLVVGVVALGVISARAVVERRQHIGVLRAIGFQPGMVRLGFLAEASFVSLAAIVLGTAMGLIIAYNVVSDVGKQQHVPFTVPWINLTVIFSVVYLASLGSTLLPALRASRVDPAEALRYQ